MRLTKQEIKSIKDIFQEVFQRGEIYLFGSRVDDNQRGGDIDLFIETDNIGSMLEKKIDFLVKLKDKIGDQKIDVVISKDINRLIEREAIKRGVKL